MEFIYLSAGVRAANLSVISQQDLDDFTAIWMEHYDPMQWHGSKPSFSPDHTWIWADYNNYGSFEEEIFAEFAKDHPHLQMEIIERHESCDDNEVRHLYHGELYERLCEIRVFETPRLIHWRNDFVESDPRLKDKEFLREFGEVIFYALEDMRPNTSAEELGEYVVRSLRSYHAAAEDMFSAVVGWDVDDLISRAKENIRLRKEDNYGL